MAQVVAAELRQLRLTRIGRLELSSAREELGSRRIPDAATKDAVVERFIVAVKYQPMQALAVKVVVVAQLVDQ